MNFKNRMGRREHSFTYPTEMEKKWYEQLKDLKIIQIPRYYFETLNFYDKFELHCFCDSNSKFCDKKAYGAIVYLRYIVEEKIETFFMAKGRIEPTEKTKKSTLTIARKELLANLL